MELVRDLLADRIGGAEFGKSTKIYKFAMIKNAKQKVLSEKPDAWIIDLGVGEPDQPASQVVVDRLSAEAGKAENRWYSDNGIDEFRQAAITYMKDVFGVEGLNPELHVNHCIGAKSALSMLPKAFINSGDHVLMTVPGYGVFATHSGYLGAKIHNMPLYAENNYLPEIEKVDEEILRNTKVCVVNYPNNPTGALATEEFYKKLVDYAHKYKFLILQDAAYAALVFDQKPTSILSIPGAMDVAVELHSLSKSFNMTGWRLGFLVGNELAVSAFKTIKDNSDSGQFRAIQLAGCTALENHQISVELSTKYKRRLHALAEIFSKHGFPAKASKGSFFMYFAAAKGTKQGHTFESGQDLSQFLIEECHLSTVPWDEVGSNIRLSATFEVSAERSEEDIYREIDSRLSRFDFVF